MCVQEPCVYLLSPPSVVIGNSSDSTTRAIPGDYEMIWHSFCFSGRCSLVSFQNITASKCSWPEASLLEGLGWDVTRSKIGAGEMSQAMNLFKSSSKGLKSQNSFSIIYIYTAHILFSPPCLRLNRSVSYLQYIILIEFLYMAANGIFTHTLLTLPTYLYV